MSAMNSHNNMGFNASTALRKPSGAGMTPLPPSPEIKPAASQLSDMDPLSLLGGGNGAKQQQQQKSNDNVPSRLRSIARYQAFAPQALACSDPILTSFSSQSNAIISSNSERPTAAISSTGIGARRLGTSSPMPQNHHNPPELASSLGAVAGARGVAVFRMSKPHEPLLMLNHATANHNMTDNEHSTSDFTASHSPSTSSIRSARHGKPVKALSFQPNVQNTFYLAAARGSGVLIWDVSGHSLSPLMGRLAMDNIVNATTSNGSNSIIPSSPLLSESDLAVSSLSWKDQNGLPLLATTTSNSACIWDLRSPLAWTKPSIRFGATNSATITTTTTRKSFLRSSSPYVQMACSPGNEIAILDSAGIVRIYDIRITDSTRYAVHALNAFPAFAYSGVGISYVSLTTAAATAGSNNRDTRSTSWVTWGWDAEDTNGVVKVFTQESDPPPSTESTRSNTKNEDYWHMDGSPGGRISQTPSMLSSLMPYHLIAQYSPPYQLACARVCPDPVENSIMTIGIVDNHENDGDQRENTNERAGGSWRAELWKIRPAKEQEQEACHQNSGNFGMEQVIGFAGGARHDSGIEAVLGKGTQFGNLLGAELAIASYKQRKSKSLEDDPKQDIQNDFCLALCCLTDQGFVTTHIVPEAIPKRAIAQTDGIGRTSPNRATLFSNGGRAKVFAEDREGGVNDAARLWGGIPDGPNTRPAKEVRIPVERVRSMQTSPTKDKNGMSALLAPQQQSTQRSYDGGGMLFEMDVPAVAYGTLTTGGIPGNQIGPIDLASRRQQEPVASVMIEDTDNTVADVRDVAAIAERMDNIETERIACPRLCGATFGPGVGGLAIFNNGDVRKMWQWYDRAAPSRLSVAPSSISAPENAFAGLGNGTGVAGKGSHDEMKFINPREFPRTMKDLKDMTAAAKDAQWGEVNESGAQSDDDGASSGGSFFEYLSTGSLSSDSENDPAEFSSIEGERGTRIYDNYFGNFRRPLAEPSSIETKKAEGEQESTSSQSGSHVPAGKVQIAGPSSDNLAPNVRVTHDFDKLALNNQSAQLAQEWELGQWQDEFSNVMLNQEKPKRSFCSDKNLERFRDTSAAPESPTSQRASGLPSYRRLVASPQKASAVSRIKSDGMLTSIAPPSVVPPKKNRIENEPGVHGGAYAVRPNRNESMVFLRKLFSHQQEGNPFPNLLSPPDSPMFHTKNRPQRNLAAIDQLQRSDRNIPPDNLEVRRDDRTNRIQPGVYALGSETVGTGVHEDDKKLLQIKASCLHNATVCKKLGETRKQGVWELLAQMVDRRLNERPDAFNGWGGRGGGALGVDLVANIMRYYETLGDVQMLATMVCVLSGGRPRTMQDSKEHLHLLPAGHDDKIKYDAYIRRYAELLFGWRLLIRRAELNKHLVQRVQESEGKVLNATTIKAGSPGITVVFNCPRCGKEAEPGTNICRFCQDFAFKCSICEDGVRGLFIVCDACGHGGHVAHITSWFKKHAECPSGCGCLCTFVRDQQRRSVTEANTSRTDSVMGGTFIDQLDD